MITRAPVACAAPGPTGDGQARRVDLVHAPRALVGRQEEQAQLQRLLSAARDGMSGVTVVHGPAGIGKTTLLEAAVAAADGYRVLRAGGIESESGLGFAALHRLLLPVLDRADALPARQRAALDTTFGRAAGEPADRFVVGLAVLSLLSAAAAEQPLLGVVDDAQWVDRESLEVITFVGRRLHADRVVLLLAVRDGEDDAVAVPEGLPALRLAGLPDADARRLLDAVSPGPLDDGVAAHIMRVTEGSPLALVELVGELSDEQRIGAGLLPDPLPVGARLEGHYQARVARLPRPTQTLLLVAAADASADPDLMLRAAKALGVGPEAVEPAEASGLVSLAPSITFRHPLVRSAIYGGAPASDRRRVHQALADATDRGADPERWVRHRTAAAVGLDENVAAELERCAERSRDRGGYATDAAYRTLAAEMTPDRRLRTMRRLAAARCHVTAGAPLAATALLERAAPALDDPVLRAEADRITAALRSYTAPGEVPALLLRAARSLETVDPALARETLAEAVQASLVSCQLTADTTMEEVARAALAAPREDSARTVPDVLVDGFATRIAVGYAESVPRLRQALGAIERGDVAPDQLERWAVFVNNLARELWDAQRARTTLKDLERFEREHGALEPLRVTLGGLAHIEMWNGRFAAAEYAHSEAAEVAVALGGDAGAWEVLKVELMAWQGDEARTRSTADLVTGELAQAFGAGVVVNIGRMALVTLDLAQGRYAEALDTAAKVTGDDVPPQGNQALPEVVEAGVRSGEVAAAEAALTRLAERVTANPTPWSQGLLARSRALLAHDDEAEPLYAAAITHLRGAGVDTELARAHLLYGEWLRRRRRRLDARDQIRTAHEMFLKMGALAFEERARGELAATGERARRRTVAASEDLTAQEARIARLAGEGATNPEIAAQLFLSPATVDYHLRKVFRKLGLTSRRQLAAAVPDLG
jgi:DNA-binding CsgD family transcriptional regulator